jgi:hypothetical protein
MRKFLEMSYSVVKHWTVESVHLNYFSSQLGGEIERISGHLKTTQQAIVRVSAFSTLNASSYFGELKICKAHRRGTLRKETIWLTHH